MNILALGRYALSVGACMALLAACSSDGSQVAPAPLAQNANERGTTSTQLLWVSSVDTNSVYVYPYPHPNHHQTLTGFSSPRGLCVDKSGNVWVSNSGASNIVGYAHDGSPATTLSDPNQVPVFCAVDPKTGDLAVANLKTTSNGSGSISIYKKAKGNPTVVPAYTQTTCVGYDRNGNLFVDGLDASNVFALGEIARGSATLTNLTWHGPTINNPGGLQYASNDLVVGDQVGSVLYQVSVSGSVATVLGNTPLIGKDSPSTDIVQFQILTTTHRVFGADDDSRQVLIYAYPAGGKPFKNLYVTGGPDGAPSGFAISE